jgi:hypothetical protein
MDFYNDTNFSGELWLRDINDNLQEVSILLSSVFLKYSSLYPDFYYDLNLNIITKFDVFYDSFFIQTPNGYIFEKIILQNSEFLPYSLFDLYSPLQSTNIDYWFDEINRKVYFCGFNDIYLESSSSIRLSLFFKEFDIKSGKINLFYEKYIYLALDTTTDLLSSNGIKDDPKLTYNKDTNIFNISFLVKNDIKQNALISINLNQNDILEINSFIPYGTLNTNNSYVDKFYPTPTPTVTPTFTPTPTKTPTPTPSVTPSLTPSVTPTLTVTLTPTKTVTPTPSVTKTPTVTPTITPTVTPTVTTSVGSVQVKAYYVSFE